MSSHKNNNSRQRMDPVELETISTLYSVDWISHNFSSIIIPSNSILNALTGDDFVYFHLWCQLITFNTFSAPLHMTSAHRFEFHLDRTQFNLVLKTICGFTQFGNSKSRKKWRNIFVLCGEYVEPISDVSVVLEFVEEVIPIQMWKKDWDFRLQEIFFLVS